MININKLQGMRFPTEAVIRMFYKEELHTFKNKKVLEFGCGSANHLMLFAQYGWQVTGIDYDPDSLKMACHNISVIGERGNFYEHDLSYKLPVLDGGFDVFLAPSCLYYLDKESAINRLKEVNHYLNPGAMIFIQMRLPDDHRNGRGVCVGKDSWILNIDYTGEKGLLNVFYSEHELVELMNKTLGVPLNGLISLKTSYENRQNGLTIRNSDIVLWGRKS